MLHRARRGDAHSSVLKSPLAIQFNISIMRTFVRLRGEATDRVEIANRLAGLEERFTSTMRRFNRSSSPLPEKKPRKIGF